HAGTVPQGRRVGANAAELLPGAFGHEPKTLSGAATHAFGTPRARREHAGHRDGHRNRHPIRVLAIRPTSGRIPDVIWRSSVSDPGPAALDRLRSLPTAWPDLPELHSA